jgi:hypothetical protein
MGLSTVNDQIHFTNLHIIMLTAEEAINIANQKLVGTFNAQDVQPEEYLLDKDKQSWLVTLSYNVPSADPNSIANLIPVRKWKTLTVDTTTGAVQSVMSGGLGDLIK